MRKTTQIMLWASCILIGIGANDIAESRNKGVSASIGGKGLVSVHANLGGPKGLRAHVSLGGKKGLANVNAKLGDTVNAKVNASVATRTGPRADVGVSVGTRTLGLNTGANIGTNDPTTTNSNANDPKNSGVTGADPNTKPGRATLTKSQSTAFQAMSSAERKAILKRCLSVGAGGYDPALANLCKLLRLSAAL